MIVTCKKRVPFLWVVLATLPWVAMIFKDKVMGIAFVFSMRKFVENPLALTFLLTLPGYISWIVPPTVNFIADRIWTRFGRRKPFIVASWIGTISSLALMPLAPDFAWLLAAYMVFCAFNDLGGPVESLKMEVVPPPQRALGAAVMAWIGQVAVLVFWVVAIGRFDEMTTMFHIPVSGEQGLYWSVCIGMTVMLLFLTLGIRETNPHSALLHERFSLRGVFGGLFSRHLWPVYILMFSVAILGSGLGAFTQLLITEQWGYTKQDQGTNIAIGGIINLFLIPLLGLFANRIGRGSVYVGLVIAGISVNFAMFFYYTRVLYDARPSLLEMVVFGEMLSVIGVLTGMALTPFVYDFIPRNELGTYAAGSGLVYRITNILTANLMGLFVWGYAAVFLGPAGEAVRVTLRDDTPKAQIDMLLQNARWTNPATGEPLLSPKLVSTPWYATGAKLDHGRGQEIRLRNDDSAKIRSLRDRLDTERGNYRTRKSYALSRLKELDEGSPPPAPVLRATPPFDGDAEGFATRLIKAASETSAALKTRGAGKAAALAAEARAELAGEEILSGGVQALEKVLDERASAFRAQVTAVLGERMLPDGGEVLGASSLPAGLLAFPLVRRPDPGTVEMTLRHLRRLSPEVVDLRVVESAGGGFSLVLGATLDGGESGPLVSRLRSALAETAVAGLKSAMPAPLPPPRVEQSRAIRLDLRILEDPLDRHVSPISRAANCVMSLFAPPPEPDRRLSALARNLRSPGRFDHVSAHPVPGDEQAIRLTAIPCKAIREAQATDTRSPVGARIAELNGSAENGAFLALFEAAVPAALEQRMTVGAPVLGSSFAKQQYDYLVAYMAVFALQLIGLGITFFFLHLVKAGVVRRRGAEEAEAVT